MQAEFFTCRPCGNQYDNTNRLPRFLPCGHTFCSECIENLLTGDLEITCPLDDKIQILQERNIEVFPVNAMLLQFLPEKPAPLPPKEAKEVTDEKREGFCEHHQEEMKSVCLTDQCKVCVYCLRSGHHSDHVVKHVKDFLVEGETRANELEQLVKDIDKHQSATMNLLEQERKELVNEIKERFDTIRKVLTVKENETIAEINFLYKLETKRVTTTFEKDEKFKNKVLELAASLKSDTINEKFFKAYKSEVPEFVTQPTFELSRKRTEDLKVTTHKGLDHFVNSVSTSIQQFHFVTHLRHYLKKTPESYYEKEDGFNAYKIRSLLKFKIEGDQLCISVIKPGVPDDHVDNLPAFEQLKGIEQVNIEFNRTEYTKDIIAMFDCIWKHLGKVTGLKLIFSDRKTNDADLLKLFEHDVWVTKEIRDLEFSVQHCAVTDQSILEFMSNLLPKMSAITSINVNLSGTHITDQAIEAFGKAILPRTGHLDKFQVNLNDTVVFDQSIMRLFNKMDNLKVFNMRLGNTRITDEALDFFENYTLKSLKKVEVFQLDLHNTVVSNGGVACLFAAYEAVKTFLLDLSGTGVNDQTIEALSESSISTMKVLENLTLNLNETQVGDQSLASLFMNMNIVKRLSLGLGTTNITMQTLEIFKRCVENKIWFEFERFHLDVENLNIDEFEICKLFAGLAEKFSFTINMTTKVANEKNIGELVKGILIPSKKTNLPANLIVQMKKKLFNNAKTS